MQIFKTIKEVKKYVADCKKNGKIIGLVPTMGALHDGHLALGLEAKKQCDIVIYSIFVNPVQFAPTEDLDKYPRTLDADIDKLGTIGVSAIFYPENLEMYPQGYKSYVKVEELSGILCGKTRINHFQGVTTVVLKLFNIVQCDKAFFGLKDYQQFTILKTMVKDLNVPVELQGIPIVRESDGLAMSSRNIFLDRNERKAALILSKTLYKIAEKFKTFTSIPDIIGFAEKMIKSEPLAKIEYLEIRQAADLAQTSSLNAQLVVLLAARFGNTRLIDNMIIN